MSLFVISDLHISGPDDPLYYSLISLLRQKSQPGDFVVLAGDVFDLFVGNKAIFRDRYSNFLQALAEAGSRGIRLHYIEGNHDFLMRRAFWGIQNLAVHGQEMTLDIGGKKFYFAHGDRVDRKDYSYRILRFFLRSPLMKAFVALAPGAWIDRIGKAGSGKSRKAKPSLPAGLPIQRIEALRHIYRSFAAERLAQGYDFVVMGHCHDLDEMYFNIGDRRGQYINVGFPRSHGSFLSWSPGEDKIHREKLP